MNNINDIIKIYADNKDYIDYFNLITSLIKEVKQILKGTSFCKYGFDDLSSTFNNKFRLGKINDFNEDNDQNRKNLSVSVSNNHNLLKNEKNGNFDFNEYINLKVPVVDVEKEINTIKIIVKLSLVKGPCS